MPLNPTKDIPVVPGLPDPTAYSGEGYFAMLLIFGTIIFLLFIWWIIIKIWGSPILTAKTSRMRGKGIIQHFENSKIGSLKLGGIGSGVIRHAKIEDGTLITIPKGINNLEGHAFINSWHLSGISVPTFLIGAITKLRQFGILTRNALEARVEQNKEQRFTNLITGAYDFNDFEDILKKAKHPTKIALEIEHVNDFIPSVNQHYTESDIQKEIWGHSMNVSDPFARIMFTTAIAVFIVAIAMYVLSSMVGGKT